MAALYQRHPAGLGNGKDRKFTHLRPDKHSILAAPRAPGKGHWHGKSAHAACGASAACCPAPAHPYGPSLRHGFLASINATHLQNAASAEISNCSRGRVGVAGPLTPCFRVANPARPQSPPEPIPGGTPRMLTFLKRSLGMPRQPQRDQVFTSSQMPYIARSQPRPGGTRKPVPDGDNAPSDSRAELPCLRPG